MAVPDNTKAVLRMRAANPGEQEGAYAVKIWGLVDTHVLHASERPVCSHPRLFMHTYRFFVYVASS
jgi:hypothetical protein